MSQELTQELLDELLNTSSCDDFINTHSFSEETLADKLSQLLSEKQLERARVVRMADLNQTYGYQIFTGSRKPSRNKLLQIVFAMALSLRDCNQLLALAGLSPLNCKKRRDAIIIFCLDRASSLQKVNEELYRFGELTIS